MRKTKYLLLSLIALTFLLSGCGSPTEVHETTITEPPVIESETTAEPTAAEAVPEETSPVPMEKTDFVLETVDGQDSIL